MINHNESPEQSPVMNWIISIFFLFMGIGIVVNSIFLGLIFILGGLILLPPIAKKIKEKYGYNFIMISSSVSTSKGKFVCTSCGYVSYPVKKIKGSGFLEIMLYLFLVSIPFALIYSIWRRTNRELICSQCKQTTIIPVNSPKGQQMISEKK